MIQSLDVLIYSFIAINIRYHIKLIFEVVPCNILLWAPMK